MYKLRIFVKTINKMSKNDPVFNINPPLNKEDYDDYMSYSLKDQIEFLYNWYIRSSILEIPDTISDLISFIRFGYSKYVLYDLYSHIAEYICRSTQYLMNNDLRYDTYPDYDGMSREKWIEILQTIQDGFKTFDSVHEFEYAEMDENQRKVVDEKRHEAFVLLEKYFQSLWH